MKYAIIGVLSAATMAAGGLYISQMIKKKSEQRLRVDKILKEEIDLEDKNAPLIEDNSEQSDPEIQNQPDQQGDESNSTALESQQSEESQETQQESA